MKIEKMVVNGTAAWRLDSREFAYIGITTEKMSVEHLCAVFPTSNLDPGADTQFYKVTPS